MVEHAAEADSFVRIDMEGSAYTEATIAMTERLHARWPGRVGTVLQAYLYRTADDAKRLVEQGIRIRLCKGAYKEPAGDRVSAEGATWTRTTCELMKYLATSGVFCGMATHDEAIIEQMRAFVRETGLPQERVRVPDAVRDPARPAAEAGGRGYGVRVYIPFGTEWYPYFMRRLAERPANVLFLAKNFFKS